MILDDALKDLLMERGATEDDIAYLQQSEAVSTLLSWASYRTDEGDCICCDGGRVHLRDCKVFAAWHALEMHEALDAIDAAHDAAIAEDARRLGQVRLGLDALSTQRLLQITDNLRDYYEQRLFSDTNMPRTFAGRVQMLNDIIGLEAQLREQPTLDDAPAVDDGDGLDVDDA